MANYSDFLNLPKSKPGSSTAYGESLLAGNIKRKQQQAESRDRFGKIIAGAKTVAKGVKWWLNEDLEEFNRSNSTLYANLDSLIKANEQVIMDQQAIVASKMSAEDYYAKQYYDQYVADAATAGKRPEYRILKEKAQEIAKQSAARQEKLYEAAKTMPTTLQEYKDAAADYYDKPDNVIGKGIELGRKAFGKMDPRVAELRDGKLTIAKLAEYEDNGMFDAAMAFKAVLATKPLSYQSAVTAILDDLPAELDKFDVHYEVSTDNRPTLPDPSDPSGKTMMPNPNFNEKMVTKIVTLIDKDGKDRSGPVETIPLSELDMKELISDAFHGNVMDEINAAGQAFINEELIKLDPAKTGKTIKGALDYMTDMQDKNAYYSIIAQALADPNFRIMEKDETTVENILLKSALSEFNRLSGDIVWDFNVAKDRAEAAKIFKQVISGTKMIGRIFTGTVGDRTVNNEALDQQIDELDEAIIIGYIKSLEKFGPAAATTFSDPFTD